MEGRGGGLYLQACSESLREASVQWKGVGKAVPHPANKAPGPKQRPPPPSPSHFLLVLGTPSAPTYSVSHAISRHITRPYARQGSDVRASSVVVMRGCSTFVLLRKRTCARPLAHIQRCQNWVGGTAMCTRQFRTSHGRHGQRRHGDRVYREWVNHERSHGVVTGGGHTTLGNNRASSRRYSTPNRHPEAPYAARVGLPRKPPSLTSGARPRVAGGSVGSNCGEEARVYTSTALG